jgi:hypothetical protein
MLLAPGTLSQLETNALSDQGQDLLCKAIKHCFPFGPLITFFSS